MTRPAIDRREFLQSVGPSALLAVGCGSAPSPASESAAPIKPLGGKSLRPVFETGTREGHEAICWEHGGNRAVRQGQWKLVSRYGVDKAT